MNPVFGCTVFSWLLYNKIVRVLKVTLLYSLCRIDDWRIGQVFDANKSHHTIVESNTDSNCLSRASARVEMVPHLKNSFFLIRLKLNLYALIKK